MGTRFLLTSDSTVPDAVKARYLAAAAGDITLTRAVDGLPHRMLRTEMVAELEDAGRVRALYRALRRASAFRRISGLGRLEMVRDGLAMRHGRELSWSQVLMAANAPMLLRASMVEGRTDLGIMASGQVAALIEDLPGVGELVDRIMAEAGGAVAALAGPGAVPPPVPPGPAAAPGPSDA